MGLCAASDRAFSQCCCGEVHFDSEDSAKQAIERVNGMQIGEKTVQVGQFLKAGDRDSEPKTSSGSLRRGV